MALSWVMWKDDARIQKAAENRPSMKSGEKGQPVHLLQACLIINDIDVPHHGITGRVQNNNFLAETARAVREAEKKFNLPSRDTGVAGKEVITRLDTECDGFYTRNAGNFGRGQAIKDAPGARLKVLAALNNIALLRTALGGPPVAVVPLPGAAAPTLALANSALLTHFRLSGPGAAAPAGGVARPATLADINRISTTCVAIAGLLAGAAAAFRDGIPVNGVKIAAEANTNSRIVTFGPMFRSFDAPFGRLIGPNSRIAILIHEGMHAVDDSNTSGNANTHISEFDPAYDVQPAEQAMFNPSSYAGFAAHAFLGRDPTPRFGLGPASRAL
jgi:hypothetical protein